MIWLSLCTSEDYDYSVVYQSCSSMDSNPHNDNAPSAVAEVMEQSQPASTSASHSVYQPASLSQVFIGVQPGRGVARLTKVGKPSGPMSLASGCVQWCCTSLCKHVLTLSIVAVAASFHRGGNNFGCSTITLGVSCKGMQHLSWLRHQQVSWQCSHSHALHTVYSNTGFGSSVSLLYLI